MSNFKAGNEFKTLVFFDLETTGLIDGLENNPLLPRRPVAGDVNRNLHEIFRTYADTIDTGTQYPLPRITEISFVAVQRSIFTDGVNRMSQKYMNSENDKTEIRTHIPSRFFCMPVNPELSESEWKEYEQKQRSMPGFHLQRSALICQPTFKDTWPLVQSFLSTLEGPIAMIGHNVINFDCRVLLSELKRVNLLESSPFPSNVYFNDSIFAFMDLEKRYHQEIQLVMSNINWKSITHVIVRKRESDFLQTVIKKRRVQIDNNGDRQPNVTSTDSDVILCDDADIPTTSNALQRPDVATDDSPPRTGQMLPNEGWRTAPARMSGFEPTAEDYKQTNPLNFMRFDNWTPAKKRRMRSDFFERKNDGDWNFCMAIANKSFVTRGTYRLAKLYSDIIRGLYTEHQAYDDCIALLQVALSFGEDFLAYIDNYSSKLNSLSAS